MQNDSNYHECNALSKETLKHQQKNETIFPLTRFSYLSCIMESYESFHNFPQGQKKYEAVTEKSMDKPLEAIIF